MLRRTAPFLILTGLTMTATADEGMWLLTDPPRQRLKEKYGFDLTDEFLKRAMLGSVRFTNGGSGGFVSPNGLVVTNHHIAADSIQKLSTAESDYYRDGFYAQSNADERKCPDLELNVLLSIEDVTARVNAVVKDGMAPADAAAARRAVMSEIEKESLDRTGQRSDVVTLYQGGVYHLYRYKKYTDVRLVFAPEASVGGFGGDVDNFEYPRFGFDVSFFRVYENDKPAPTPSYFKWSGTGPAEGDLAFVTGHPGTTNRLETLAKLQHRRDRSHPYTLARLRAMEAALLQFGESSPESKRRAATNLHSAANARKAFAGQYQGLLTPDVMAQKSASERTLFEDPKASAGGAAAAAVRTIADVQTKLAEFETEYFLLETGHAITSDLFTIARHLVRMAEEMPKPSGTRLREYRDSNLDSVKQQLFSPAPIYPDLERAKLTASLTFACEQKGATWAPLAAALAGLNPATRAEDLVAGTKLADPVERRKLFDGGKAAIDASTDPMIVLARSVDVAARALRAKFESSVEEPERQAYATLAKARFAVSGKALPPDATFTLRLAYGKVSGYSVGGNALPFHTTVGGAFARAEAFGNKEPFDLPKKWLNAKGSIDLATPFDFVSTADTIGGNSGSPVLNRAGELIGVNFDRNRHGLVRNFVYTDVQARHIAVHCRVVREALAKVYGAKELLKELDGN
jgi:hypothetical protein